jgi:hypothetical protein
MKAKRHAKVEAPAPSAAYMEYQHTRVDMDVLRRDLQKAHSQLEKLQEEIEKRMAEHPKAVYSPEARDRDAAKLADAKISVNEVREQMRGCENTIKHFEFAEASKGYAAALIAMEAAADEIRPHAVAAVEAAQTLLQSVRSMEPLLRKHESQRGNFDRARRKVYEIGSLDGEPLPPTVAPLHCQLPMDFNGFLSLVHKQLVGPRDRRIELDDAEIAKRYPALRATAATADALPEEEDV